VILLVLLSMLFAYLIAPLGVAATSNGGHTMSRRIAPVLSMIATHGGTNEMSHTRRPRARVTIPHRMEDI
jgi:hypothetical protein